MLLIKIPKCALKCTTPAKVCFYVLADEVQLVASDLF